MWLRSALIMWEKCSSLWIFFGIDFITYRTLSHISPTTSSSSTSRNISLYLCLFYDIKIIHSRKPLTFNCSTSQTVYITKMPSFRSLHPRYLSFSAASLIKWLQSGQQIFRYFDVIDPIAITPKKGLNTPYGMNLINRSRDIAIEGFICY